jgi:hypothetical protein
MKKNHGMGWLKNLLIGNARSLSDQGLFHKLSLAAVLAWVGLGADGLSSSCYGPEETFKVLGAHAALAPFVAAACVFTIAVICVSYVQIIAAFPGGGGGYLVATKLLGPRAGVVSGCALLVDYVLTIAISIASGADALFSLLPAEWAHGKLAFALGGTAVLTLLNLRGVRESVLVCVPVFFVFLGTHGFAIAFALLSHAGAFPEVGRGLSSEVAGAHAELGWAGLLLLLVRAYSMGAGTYTGIEAVSNGLPILREPRVATGQRTMFYMGLSLGLTAAGLMMAYLLYRVSPQEGKTLNAVLFENIAAPWGSAGRVFVSVALLSATALLFIAAQAGFLDGPRVLANMALDRWFPARFAALSDRFVAQNGILLMGAAASLVLALAQGSVALLVVLYSINVFITFLLSQAGMVRHWWRGRGVVRGWKARLAVNGVGLCLTGFILLSLCFVKFWEGGWVTLVATGAVIGLALWIRRHYERAGRDLDRLNGLATAVEAELAEAPELPEPAMDPAARTAVLLVNGFNGLGLHTLLAVTRLFPGVFRNFVFLHVGVVDAGNFKGADEIGRLGAHIAREAERYARYMRLKGFSAEAVTLIGNEVVASASALVEATARRYSNSVFFGGQLVFGRESWSSRLLHNFAVFALQRECFRRNLPFVIVPIKAP